MSDVKWSEWTNWNSVDKPPTLHSNTRIQAVNDEGYTLGEGNWHFTARDCEWSEITAYRYQITDQPEVTDAEEEEWQRMEWSKQITDTDEEAQVLEDMVNHPPHYQSDNGIECIDAIRAALGLDGFVAHCRGTAIKYCWRSGKKQAHAEDLRKAAWYLNEAADALEEQ